RPARRNGRNRLYVAPTNTWRARNRGPFTSLVRKPALSVASRFAPAERRVRFVRVACLLLDTGAVAKRGLVDRVAAPVRASRALPRTDGNDDTRPFACPDDRVLRLWWTAHESPATPPPCA